MGVLIPIGNQLYIHIPLLCHLKNIDDGRSIKGFYALNLSKASIPISISERRLPLGSDCQVLNIAIQGGNLKFQLSSGDLAFSTEIFHFEMRTIFDKFQTIATI